MYVRRPGGIDLSRQRDVVDAVQSLNELQSGLLQDPEITTRISQYELAFKMQTSVPELMDISDEPQNILDLYGTKGGDGSYASNCLLARRMAERGVRFIQLYHRGWDHHSSLPNNMRGQCRDVDQPTAALLKDLKLRGLLDDTLVVFVGEFGRTVYGQGNITRTNYGRDHHPRCFSGWLAGGGIKGGMHYGKTDDFSYNVAENPVHVRDLHATMLHQLGIDHRKLTFPFQGLDQKLTGVEKSRVIKEIIS